jgi:uncharacterized membrane protein
VERVERPNQGARRRLVPSWSRFRLLLAPFEDVSPYPGLGSKSESRLVGDLGPRLLLVLATLLYAYYYGKLTLDRFDAFHQPGFDLGIFDQGVWLLSRFKDPFVSIMGLNLFGDHASYILLAFVPLYWIWPAPQLLLLAQTLALAVAAIPVFLLARRVLHNSWIALLPALAFLLNPALGWVNVENFHPDSFEVPLVLFALYFMTVHRWRAYMAMVVLALLVKEDVALLVVPLGLYVAFRHDRRVGLTTADIGVAWFIATVFFLGPLLSGTTAGTLDAFRVPFGGWRGLISMAIREPWEVIAHMLTAEKVKYLIQLLAPLVFLPVMTAGSLIVVPSIAFNLLSTFSYQTNLRYHYTSLIIPVFAWTALLCLQRVKHSGTRRAVVVAMLVATLLSAYAWGSADWSRDPAFHYDPKHPQTKAVEEAIALVPDDAVVSARSRMATHLAHREQVYEFPTPFYASYWGDGSSNGQRLAAADEVDYVLETPDRLTGPALTIFAGLEQEGFREIFSREGVVLLQRVGPGAGPAGSSASASPPASN